MKRIFSLWICQRENNHDGSSTRAMNLISLIFIDVFDNCEQKFQANYIFRLSQKEYLKFLLILAKKIQK